MLENMIKKDLMSNNPITKLNNFIEQQNMFKDMNSQKEWRFVGYVLELSFEQATIITCDAYKNNVGGIPRGSFLIQVPYNVDAGRPHFTLLRVKGVSTTPLSKQVQQTYFEMHKKAMPELDVWTQADLQWGALECDVLGMYYPHPQNINAVSFSGDVNNVVSAHRYEVYSPNEELLDLIINSLVPNKRNDVIGTLRTMECQYDSGLSQCKDVNVHLSIEDFVGARTAMFGKTRLGKSNAVKLIVQNTINTTMGKDKVGQLIFDINGEYANDNDQDKGSLYSANPNSCELYAMSDRGLNQAKRLSLNFYEQPERCFSILGSFLKKDGQTANYVTSFASVNLPSIDQIKDLGFGEKDRAIRKIQIYWAILHKAGFPLDSSRLGKYKTVFKRNIFDPKYYSNARTKAYEKKPVPEAVKSIDELYKELKTLYTYQLNSGDVLKSSSGKPLFDQDDEALLQFLFTTTGSGVKMIRKYMIYHSPYADDFVNGVLTSLDNGKTVILDLGNANEEVRSYFSDLLSRSVFSHQEEKFVNNKLNDDYIQLYFEEAHNLFPPESKDLTDVYSRFAKEGAKFHIGMIYSTQSPSTISKELLVQTENFFVGHLSSREEAKALSKLQVAFEGVEPDILRSKTPGFMRMLTQSHRFVVPVQTRLYSPKKGGDNNGISE